FTVQARGRLHEGDDEVDDVDEGVRRPVDVHRAFGHHEGRGGAAGVDLVAGEQGLAGGLDVGAALLECAAVGARGGVGGQEDLDVGVGSDHRADVASLDHD